MSAPRALTRAIKCKSCQLHALSTFAGFAGVTIAAARPLPAASCKPARHFTAAARLRNNDKAEDGSPFHTGRNLGKANLVTDIALQDSTETTVEESSSLQATPSVQDPGIPWYLQVQESDQSTIGQSSRQQLPDLPLESPEKLGPTIEYLFKEAGLDDMRILDLRKMDPPPALGSNLIMVLGTTRSERHLHVSADRFCRWLRSNYNLQPFADGLLGRNELKLKLRRKAKRAKLLGSKGPVENDTDDGIRTGWICVNAGRIEESGDAKPSDVEREGIIGFGGTENGVHLIVQMMTEEKREELDLEKLWLDALARQERKENREQAKQDEDIQVGSNSVSFTNPADINAHSRTNNSISLQRQQIRTFHTHMRSVQQEVRSEEEPSEENIAPSSGLKERENTNGPSPGESQVFERVGMRYDLKDFWSITRPQLIEPYESSLRALASLPSEKAIVMLGNGPDCIGGTEFLNECFSRKHIFPSSDYWACRLWIACYGMLLGHSSYSPERVRSLFNTMENNLPEAPSYLFKLAVDTFVPCVSSYGNAAPRYPAVGQESIHFLVGMLSRLHGKHSEVDDCFIFERLYLAKIRFLLVQMNTAKPEAAMTEIDELNRLYNTFGLGNSHSLSEAFHLNALEALADLSPNLEAFLNHWESIPLYSYSRSAALYNLFFKRLAMTKNPGLVAKALDEWVEMMDLENPPVALEERIADNVIRCLEVVNPDIGRVASRGPNQEDFWISLWRRCQGYWDSEVDKGDQ